MSADLFEWTRPKSLARQRFEEFDAANPRIYELFKRFAFQAAGAGRKHFGARLIAERIRWEVMIETTGGDFKLNDHFTPFYVRKFLADHPDYREFFELRSSVADAQ